jgi:hypothetical protein
MSFSFLTSALDGASGQRHAQASLYPRKRNNVTNWTRGLVDPRARLDTESSGKIRCLC